jgi:hypothetical protein
MQMALFFPPWLTTRLFMDLADHPIIATTVAVIAIAAFIFWLLRSNIN